MNLFIFFRERNKMAIQVGQDAPDFTLYNTDQKEISLKDLTANSNVVILFFPLAFTSVCTEELCSARDDISKYQKLNATVVGISVDSLFTLKKFREEQKLPYDLLSDFNKETAKKYDSLYDQFPVFGLRGVTKRSAFVINKQGKIKYAQILDDPGKVPDFNQIKQTLENIDK
jgi:peroxiredoxin